VRASGTVVELAIFLAGTGFYLVDRNSGPKGPEREEMQLNDVASAAVEVVVLGAVYRLATMFG